MRRIKVLIADDHPVFREGLSSMLSNETDFLVLGEACNGQDAINKALALRPDIVLMDLRMPVLDGIEAMKRIRVKDPKIQFVILTTYDNDEYIFGGIEAGARGYLLKDSSREEVFNVIKAVFQGESVIQPKIATKVLDRFAKMANISERHSEFSERELEVLKLMAKGFSNKNIAEKLLIGESTVKTHIQNIFHSLRVNDRTEAVTEAIKRGILHP